MYLDWRQWGHLSLVTVTLVTVAETVQSGLLVGEHDDVGALCVATLSARPQIATRVMVVKLLDGAGDRQQAPHRALDNVLSSLRGAPWGTAQVLDLLPARLSVPARRLRAPAQILTILHSTWLFPPHRADRKPHINNHAWQRWGAFTLT